MSIDMSGLRDSNLMLQFMYQAMLKLKLDVNEVFNLCGIDSKKVIDKNFRPRHKDQFIFWQAVEYVSQDPDIGLHLSEEMPIFKGQVLQYLFLSSSTFGDGLKRSLKYQRILSDALYLTLNERSSPSITIDTLVDNQHDIRHTNECMMNGLITFFKFVTNNEFEPLKIEFTHEQPATINEHERIYGCELSFSQPSNRIYFSAELLERPSLHFEPELLQLHEKLASEQVAKLEKQDVVIKANAVIAEMLETGTVSLEVISNHIGTHPRALRAQFSEMGTSFNQLLATYRCNLAEKLLANTNESIDEIVYLTGFSEPSTFYRAFKRWKNTTPIEYRKTHSK
jgi:AraC-like DNA-binding protein